MTTNDDTLIDSVCVFSINPMDCVVTITEGYNSIEHHDGPVNVGAVKDYNQPYSSIIWPETRIDDNSGFSTLTTYLNYVNYPGQQNTYISWPKIKENGKVQQFHILKSEWQYLHSKIHNRKDNQKFSLYGYQKKLTTPVDSSHTLAWSICTQPSVLVTYFNYIKDHYYDDHHMMLSIIGDTLNVTNQKDQEKNFVTRSFVNSRTRVIASKQGEMYWVEFLVSKK